MILSSPKLKDIKISFSKIQNLNCSGGLGERLCILNSLIKIDSITDSFYMDFFTEVTRVKCNEIYSYFYFLPSTINIFLNLMSIILEKLSELKDLFHFGRVPDLKCL